MSFEFATADRILVGVGRATELPSVLDRFGSHALVCTGSSPRRHAHLVAELPTPYSTFTVTGEPTINEVRAATKLAAEQEINVVVAIGGGSVIDLGKAVATMMGNGGDPLDYIEVIGAGRKISQPSVPCIAVPTTAGTGSEVTANAVLTSPKHGLKASLRSPLMIPRVALVDPALTVSCPPSVTASSGLDAFTQCLEPFVSVKANPLSDALAREGLRHAALGLRRAYANGSDLDARCDMAICSLLGGMALANAKLGAVHGMAGVIGGMFSIPHGVACAALLLPVIETNVEKLRSRHPDSRALAKYEEVARLVTGRPSAPVEDGIVWIRETVNELGVPGLREFGVRNEHADEIVAKTATASSTQGNPIVLDEADLRRILADASLPFLKILQ